MLCILLVVFGRVVMVFTPLALAKVVEIFEDGTKTSPWPYLLAYVALRFLQGTGGIAALRDVSNYPSAFVLKLLICRSLASLDPCHAVL